MAAILRRLVSTNKRRYQQDGYDLDLSYITPRVIAMGFPSHGVTSLYRNPAGQVAQLLTQRHGDHFKVYNLCIERGYDVAIFGGRVVRSPMYDGQAPPLHLMLEVCRDAAAWLAAAPEHVIVVHCKAGKGRTGAVVCALLLALDPELSHASLASVLAFWAHQRTKDGKGLTIPSQRRFLSYFHELLLHASPGAAVTSLASGEAVAPRGAGGNPQEVPEAREADTGAAAVDLPSGRGATVTTEMPSNGASSAVATTSTTTAGDGIARNGTTARCQAGMPAAPSPCKQLQPLTATPLQLARVPTCAARLLRLRFRGLPLSLLRDCTASVWWRPLGHHEAVAVCHVQTRGARGGCAGCTSAAGSAATPSDGGAQWSLRTYVSPSDDASGGGGSDARVRAAGELEIDLSRLPSPSPPPPPSSYTLCPTPQLETATASASSPPLPTAGMTARMTVTATALACAAAPAPASAEAGPEPEPGSGNPALAPGTAERSADDGKGPPCPSPQSTTGSAAATAGPGGPPMLAGDIKIQIFRGCLLDPPHDVFKGRVSQFSAWLGTAFLDPAVGVLELGRTELDKLSKPLRRWRGPISLVVEYDMA